MDGGELPAAVRSAVPDDSVAVVRDGGGEHGALPGTGVSRGAIYFAGDEAPQSLSATRDATFWTSFLVRTYAWLFLLRDTGLINTVLQSLGVIHAPLPLLYNDGAVLLGLVYGYLPFMVLRSMRRSSGSTPR